MADNLTEAQRKKNMQAIRSVNTKMETFISKELWHRGFRFRKNVKNLLGKPDIAIKKYKLVVFLDSCFWHGCDLHCIYPKSNTEYWNQKISRNIQRDIKVNDYYSEKGWHVLRIWEHDFKEDKYKVVDKIECFFNYYKRETNKLKKQRLQSRY